MMSLFAVLLAAQGAASLTPAMLADAVQCRSRDAHDAVGEAVSGNALPDWMHERKTSGDDTFDLIGMTGYALDRPITVFGQSVDSIAVYYDWMVVALPRAAAQDVIADHKMALAPIANTRQYYHFIDPENGPMLGAFESPDRALAVAFGGSADDIPPPDTLFVGCNYLPVSKADFLDMAKAADARMKGAVNDIRDMAEDMDSSTVQRAPDTKSTGTPPTDREDTREQ